MHKQERRHADVVAGAAPAADRGSRLLHPTHIAGRDSGPAMHCLCRGRQQIKSPLQAQVARSLRDWQSGDRIIKVQGSPHGRTVSIGACERRQTALSQRDGGCRFRARAQRVAGVGVCPGENPARSDFGVLYQTDFGTSGRRSEMQSGTQCASCGLHASAPEVRGALGAQRFTFQRNIVSTLGNFDHVSGQLSRALVFDLADRDLPLSAKGAKQQIGASGG